MTYEEQSLLLLQEQSRLIKYLIGLGCSFQNAEDIVQNMHLKILEKRYNIKNKNYLYCAAKCKFIQMSKLRKKEILTNNSFLLDEFITEKNNSEDILSAAIANLKPVSKMAIKMLYWENKSKKDIAKTIGITESGLNNVIHKAKKSIKKYLLEKKIDD